MEFGPIFRALSRNKTRMILIVLEVALTLAIVVNCINMMQDMRHKMDRPTGMAEEEIITIHSMPFLEEFREDGYFDNVRKADLDLLRSLPGVRSAESFSQIPLSGSGSSSGYKPLGSEMNALATAMLWAGPDAVKTMGPRIIAGRDLTEDDITESDSKNVIITRTFADRLFPDGDALGKQIQDREPINPHTIVGIVDYMHGFWPNWEYIEHVVILPDEPGSFNWGVRYMIRVEPGKMAPLLSSLEGTLLAANDGRNVTIRPLGEVKSDTFEGETAVVKILQAVIVLLVFVTALGIVGMTSFSVTERTHHIGTRRALGASRLDILRYFLTENWIITSIGLVLGTGLAYGLNYFLVSYVSGAKLNWPLLVYGLLLMWAVGQLSAFFPAWKGARVSPAIATKNV